jgi:hypothetical protein
MSDDIVVIRPIGPTQNVNRLAPANKDREKNMKNFYKKNEKQNADGQNPEIEPDLTSAEPTDNSSDGHSIDIKA